MTLKETLEQLEALIDERTRIHNMKKGVGENQYGVKLGDIRKVAKKIKTNHVLALELWKTEENEMSTAAPEAQWTMNFSLVEIGVNHPKHRQQ